MESLCLVDSHVDSEILSRLDGRSLVRTSQVNSYFNKLSEIDKVWMQAIELDFGAHILQYVPPGSYRSYYRKLATATVSSQSMNDALRNDDVAMMSYLLDKGMKIFLSAFRPIDYRDLLSDIFTIGNWTTPTPDDVNTIIQSDSVEILKYLDINGLRTSESFLMKLHSNEVFLQHAVGNGALKITKWLWKQSPHVNPDIVLHSTAFDCNLDMLKWWAKPPRNWRPRNIGLVVCHINHQHWDMVNWMLEQGCVPTEVDEDAIYGGIPSLEWYEQRGLLSDSNVANNIIYQGSQADYVNFEMLDWLAERHIFPDLNIEDIADVMDEDIMARLREWYKKWGV